MIPKDTVQYSKYSKQQNMITTLTGNHGGVIWTSVKWTQMIRTGCSGETEDEEHYSEWASFEQVGF